MKQKRLQLTCGLLATALFLAACGSQDGSSSRADGSDGSDPSSFSTPFGDTDAYPVFISSEVVVGSNRFLLGLLDKNDAPIGRPGIAVQVSFYDLAATGKQITQTKDMNFIWSTPGERGVYVTDASFNHAGKWGAEVSIEGGGLDETVRASFDVAPTSVTPAVGNPAPKSDTPTGADVADLSEISTDRHPDPRFYKLSVADAVTSGRPTVVTFATPKFCTSAVCGPTLNIVKKVSKQFPGINFVHVEVYKNLDDPANLETVPSVNQWKLRTEPWVFVVDSRGRIAAKYEGIVGTSELRAELNSL
jgi:hypothetical protein